VSSSALQQLINGVALGSIYALIALGYTMVYGVLRFINFAHADILMIGAYTAYFVAPILAPVFGGPSLGLLLATVLISAVVCAGIGMGIEWVAYRPLRQRPKLTVLITAIGVSLLIEFGCQHPAVFGAATRPFPELLSGGSLAIAGATVSRVDLLIPVVTLLLMGVLWWLVQRTRMGMAMRAVAYNQQAAALMGVNIHRVIAFTFGLGSALAAVAGVLYSVRSSGIDPLMGIRPGLIAFSAAVVGGIGDLGGAILGGLVLGLLETYVGGVPALSNYRDAISFGMLIVILLFRPSGILGRAQVEKV
jgi:branched-chain amino acid transport system permease protein